MSKDKKNDKKEKPKGVKIEVLKLVEFKDVPILIELIGQYTARYVFTYEGEFYSSHNEFYREDGKDLNKSQKARAAGMTLSQAVSTIIELDKGKKALKKQALKKDKVIN